MRGTPILTAIIDTFTNVPHRFLNKEVRITVDCKDLHRVDTTVLLAKNVQLNVYRDKNVFD